MRTIAHLLVTFLSTFSDSRTDCSHQSDFTQKSEIMRHTKPAQIKTPNRENVLPIVFASSADMEVLKNPQPTWEPMALTWDQRLSRQLLFLNTDTLQVEWQAFLDDEEPWRRCDGGLLHMPKLAVVDQPIIPVGVSEIAWTLCTSSWLSTPQINPRIEAISADMDDFHDSIDTNSFLLDDTYAVDMIVGGVHRNRNDPDHRRELDFRSLMTEYAEQHVKLIDAPYSALPDNWSESIPQEQHDSLLALLNS